MDHLRKTLTHCKYPKWAIDRVERRLTKPNSEESNDTNNQDTSGAKPTTNEGLYSYTLHLGSVQKHQNDL